MNNLIPQHIDQATLAFPVKIQKLMPEYKDIPDEFKSPRNIWVEFQSDWFYKGLGELKVVVKPGICKEDALNHLAAIQNSWLPKHEHKEAAVAYLASLWFDKVTSGDKVYETKA